MMSKQNTIKYPYPNDIKKCEILIIATQMISKKDDTRPTLGRLFNFVRKL